VVIALHLPKSSDGTYFLGIKKIPLCSCLRKELTTAIVGEDNPQQGKETIMFTIALKDIRQYLKDRTAVLLSLLLPMVLITIFALMYGGIGKPKESRPISLLFTDQDNSELSKEVFTTLNDQDGMQLFAKHSEEGNTEALAQERLKECLHLLLGVRPEKPVSETPLDMFSTPPGGSSPEFFSPSGGSGGKPLF